MQCHYCHREVAPADLQEFVGKPVCTKCMASYGLQRAARGGAATIAPATLCLACNGPMALMGAIPMRVGGEEGAHGIGRLWMNLADFARERMGERLWHITAFRCQNCRRLEFYDLHSDA
ncbi:MAG: hypothetical protein ACYCW6_28540 [Candidatus Xenobia bacterium]